MHPLNVCLISPLPPPYGGITHWTNMILAYAQTRQDVNLSVINTAPRWRSIHSRQLWLRLLGGSLQFIRDILKFLAALLRNKFDAIHITTSGHLAIPRDLIIIFIARFLSIPVIYHIRFGRIPDIIRARTFEWKLLSICLTKADTVIAIDASTCRSINLAKPDVNLHFIPNCIDVAALPQQNNTANSENYVLFVGWVIPAKGIEDLLAAWQLAPPSNWELKIVGSYSKDYLEFLTNKHSLRNVSFLGELPHKKVISLMSECGVFILPSHSEGFPNVILEAMALRKAAIATRVGAIPEMLNHGCGILVEAHNVDDLSKAINLVCNDPTLRANLGHQAFKRVAENYSLPTVFNSYTRLWRGLPSPIESRFTSR